MKKSSVLIILALLTIHLTAQERQVFDPKLSPLQRTELKIGIVDVSLEYSRPSMRGRTIFGDLVPYDKIWRTGANLNTMLTFNQPLLFGGVLVQAGTYTLFTKPGQEEWEVYIHQEWPEFGAPATLDPKNIVAQFQVPAQEMSRTVETLSIGFDQLSRKAAVLSIAWEQTYVPIPIEVPTGLILDEILARERETLMEDYRAAANIYFAVDKNSEAALAAIDQSILLLLNGKSFEEWLAAADLTDRHLPNKFRLKSEILADLGRREEAIQFARTSLRIAELVDDDYYKQLNEENLLKWGAN
ncbi:MAG: DUF2911 domain-containing protein [Bacteroidota bacterium]